MESKKYTIRVILPQSTSSNYLVQEYETDAGIQKWTQQRLTKSSTQVSSYVKMYHSTISPSPYQAVISDLQLLLKLLESACMLKELPSHFPYSFP